MKRAEVILVVVLRNETHIHPDLAGGLSTRAIVGENRLVYYGAVLPLLTLGMTISGGVANGRPWDGYRVDSIHADADTGRVTAEMIISAQDSLALAALVREWKAKGWR